MAGKFLTKEIKERIIEKHTQGIKAPVISEHLMISERSVYRVMNQYKKNEDMGPKTENRGRKSGFTEEQKQNIMNLVAEKPNITLHKLIEKIGINVVESTMSRILKKLGYKRKKGIYTR